MYDLTSTYDQHFFEGNTEDSQPTARYLAPIIVEYFRVKKVVDFGCATGHWLAEFQKAGAQAIGIEGSQSIVSHLLVSPKDIVLHDLRTPIKNNSKLNNFLGEEGADLAFSFEVLEHVEEQYADVLLQNMVVGNPSTIILTAAPPGQGGLGHVNEQPKSYWLQKFYQLHYVLDPVGHNFLVAKVNEGRARTDAPSELQRPDMDRICPRFSNTTGCEKGVWCPPWLPGNLMVLKRKDK